MHRLLTILMILAAAFAARAQEEDLFADEFELLAEEDVVVAAAKHKQKIGFSPSQVIVITRQDIEESGAVSLVDLLRRQSTFFIYLTNPAFPEMHVRGGYQVLMLLDGRELNVELYPHPFFNFTPVGLHDIERIELVIGPNSALYGANAVAAVINVMTRKPSREFHADVSTAAGQNGVTVLGGRLEGGAGRWSFAGSFGLDRENSWMNQDETLKNLTRASLVARLGLEDGSLTLDGSLMCGNMLVFSLNLGDMLISNSLLTHAQAALELGGLKARAYWYGVRTDLDIDLDLYHPQAGIVLGTLPTIDIAGDTAHAEAQYDLEPFEGNLLIAGADFRYTSYRSDQTVDPQLEEMRVGVFLHDEQWIGNWLLVTAGARFDWNSKTESAVSPQVALVFSLADEQFLRLASGTAFRKPTLMETGANFKIDANFQEIKKLFEEKGIANPRLDNEILGMVEAGYLGSFFNRALRIDAVGYFGFARDPVEFISEIQFRPPPLNLQINVEASRIGYVNMSGGADEVGAHLGVRGEPCKELTLFLTFDYQYRWWIDDNHQDRWDPVFMSSAGGVLRLPLGIILHLSAMAKGSRVHEIRSPESVLLPVLGTKIPAQLHVLAALTYRLDLGPARIDLGLSVFHLFGGRYREALGVITRDGSNFGGELMGTQAMFTARLQY